MKTLFFIRRLAFEMLEILCPWLVVIAAVGALFGLIHLVSSYPRQFFNTVLIAAIGFVCWWVFDQWQTFQREWERDRNDMGERLWWELQRGWWEVWQ